MVDPTQRFSSRVENYIKYRPGYPPAVLDLLERECGIGRGSVVADLGSGTGIFAAQLLDRGCTVLAVEPNLEMREAAERLLEKKPQFKSIAASAEATTIPNQCVDAITVAQAFHWFDRDRARAEFERILKPRGWIALIWNSRRVDTSPFLQAYERLLLTHGTDYAAVNHREISDEAIAEFFTPATVAKATFFNVQRFDYDGLEGRLLSSSYTPEEGDPRRAELRQALRAIFDAHQLDGVVDFEYDTEVYYGQL